MNVFIKKTIKSFIFSLLLLNSKNINAKIFSDQILVEINGHAFSQYHVELYLALKHIMTPYMNHPFNPADYTINSLYLNPAHLDSFILDQILFHEATKQGRINFDSEYAKIIFEKIKLEPMLQVFFEKYNLDRLETIELIEEITQIDEFHKAKDDKFVKNIWQNHKIRNLSYLKPPYSIHKP